MGLKLGDRLIVLKTKRDIQLSYDCKSAKTIIANNADYTPASSYALAAYLDSRVRTLSLRGVTWEQKNSPTTPIIG